MHVGSIHSKSCTMESLDQPLWSVSRVRRHFPTWSYFGLNFAVVIGFSSPVREASRLTADGLAIRADGVRQCPVSGKSDPAADRPIMAG